MTGHSAGLGLLAIVTLVAFAPALAAGFTNFDDHLYVVNNPLIRGLDGTHLWAMFTDRGLAHYQPLVWLSYAIEYRLVGMAPWLYHLTNIVLHIVNALLVWRLFVLLGLRPWGALIGAAVFAVHPLRVESVAWVTERKDVLFAVFYLVALTEYLRCMSGTNASALLVPAVDRHQEFETADQSVWDRRLTVALGAFVLALLAKAGAVTLPVVLLMAELWLPGGDLRRHWRRLVPFFAIGGGVALLAISNAAPYAGTLEGPARLAVVAFGLLFYPTKLLFFSGLSPYYPYPGLAWSEFPVWLQAAPVVALVAVPLLVRVARRAPRALFLLAFYGITVGPFLQWVPLGPVIAANWFTYLSLLGPLALIIAAAERVVVPTRRPSGAGGAWVAGVGLMAVVLAVVFIVACVGETRRRCRVWHDSIALWTEVIRVQPCDDAYINRAMAHLDHGNLASCAADLDAAAALDEPTGLALLTRARLQFRRGRPMDALLLLDVARRVDPTARDIDLERGEILLALGSPTAALPLLDALVQSESGQAWAQVLRSRCLRMLGRPADALVAADRAVALGPDRAEAYVERAIVWRDLGQTQKSAVDIDRAIAAGWRPAPPK